MFVYFEIISPVAALKLKSDEQMKNSWGKVWVVGSTSRLSGLGKRKIIADRQLWVEWRL